MMLGVLCHKNGQTSMLAHEKYQYVPSKTHIGPILMCVPVKALVTNSNCPKKKKGEMLTGNVILERHEQHTE